MTDPLKILNTIEAEDTGVLKQYAAVMPGRLRELRTALEAQAEELAQAKARIARLHEQLQEYHDNAHYDGEDLYIGCCITEAQYQHCGKLLKETAPQSLAASKAWDWKRLDQQLPPERGRWYLFGGWADNGDWVFDKMYYSLNGLVNGWSVGTALHNGNTHWCDVVPPADRIEREAKEES